MDELVLSKRFDANDRRHRRCPLDDTLTLRRLELARLQDRYRRVAGYEPGTARLFEWLVREPGAAERG